ncbi:MAG: ATP phosphoribosyltransferase [Lactobacillales bacterium]|jgi:ATP phosphoribosyltransferase|nr:ATP phosphoribosyltransferase [Lactobacillales bacterium]
MKRMKIALQRSGRLMETSANFLRLLEVQDQVEDRKLVAQSPTYPIDVCFVRDEDIPTLIERGKADFGIVGENVLAEIGRGTDKIDTIKKMGTGKCRLSIAIPEAMEWNGIDDLNSQRIATSYDYLGAEFIKENKLTAELCILKGSVEIAPAIGVGDVILDLVSSGETLRKNGMKEVYTVMESEVVLACQSGISAADRQNLIELFERAQALPPTPKKDRKSLEFLNILGEIIKGRSKEDPAKSYTASLFKKGVERIAQKVGEEGVEVALSAVANQGKLLEESADLIYHLSVLLVYKGKTLADVANVLKARNKAAPTR